jgi:hypothetical protein
MSTGSTSECTPAGPVAEAGTLAGVPGPRPPGDSADPAPGTRWRLAVSLLVASGLYVALWLSLALPYRLFPSDDVAYLEIVTPGGGLESTLRRFRWTHVSTPLGWTLIQVSRIWARVSADARSSLLFFNVVCGALTMACVTLAIFSLTGSAIAAAAGLVLFCASPWSASYMVFFSHAPFAGSVLALTCLLLLRARLAGRGASILVALAGVANGCLAWTVTSAALAAASMAVAALFLLGSLPPRRRFWLSVAFTGSFVVTTALLSVHEAAGVLEHIRQNLESYHQADAVRKFGFLPRMPPPSFLRIAWIVDPVFLVAFAAALAALLVHRLRSPDPVAVDPRAGAAMTPLTVLSLVVLAHALIIDLLPTTKLARTHYPVYPVALVFTVSVGAILLRSLAQPARVVGSVAALALCAGGVAYDVRMDRRLVDVRQALPRFLGANGLSAAWLLEEDPHGPSLLHWLRPETARSVQSTELARSKLPERGTALILGPRGRGSGNSVMRHGCLPDFEVSDLDRLLHANGFERALFPYAAHFPAFLMEEEICQGLYFAGLVPGDLDEEKQVAVYFRNPCP